MGGNGRAAESRELCAVYPERRASSGAYEHGADGRGGDRQSAHDHCQRRLLAERHGASADNGNIREGARSLCTRDHALSLMDAIRKMTLMPAQRLEARVPPMRQKGRLRVGADADITILTRRRCWIARPIESHRSRRSAFST